MSRIILKTKRLVLKEMTLDDDAFVLELLNSPTWIKFIGDRGVDSLEEAKDYLREHLIPSYNEYGFGFYKMCLKKGAIPLGICGFVKRDYLEHTDIGYAILPQYEGKGYTSEAAQAMMNYGIEELKLHPILAITSPINAASQHLLKKIGLKEKGTTLSPQHVEELLLFSNE